jgi:hypothetical protein
MYQKITDASFEGLLGRSVELYCQVGVLCSITGKLEIGGLAKWQVRMTNDQTIGFSFGEFKILPSETISIRIA